MHAVARDDDTPVSGVAVTLSRLDDFETLLAADEIAQWVQRPSGTTDETGHLWMRGVYPGLYRLAGTLQKDDANWYFVEFRDPDDREWSRTLEREYAGEEVDEIEIRLAPAGSVRGRLHCTDGSTLPAEADILVLPGNRMRSDSTATDWLAEALHRENGHVLEGRRRDQLTIGPLEFGAYNLLVRPDGHDRWTWALGTESPEEASVLSVTSGEPTDLGSVAVDCGPAIVIRPQPPEGIPLPDLVASARYDPSAELSGTIVEDEQVRSLGRARTLIESWRYQFRDLPEGEARLTAIVRNPFFLPGPEIRVTVEATLERGKTVEIAPPLAGIGGAIEISLPDDLAGAVVAARAIREPIGEEPAEARIWQVRDTDVLIPSLPQGTYRVEVCLDAECEDVRAPWGVLEVRPGVVVSPARR